MQDLGQTEGLLVSLLVDEIYTHNLAVKRELLLEMLACAAEVGVVVAGELHLQEYSTVSNAF